MKYRMACVLSLALIVCGCKKEESSGPPTPGPKEDVTASDVAREAEEALETASEFTQEEWRKYREAAQTRLNKLDERLDKLKGRADSLSDEAQRKWKKRMDDLAEKRAAVEQRMAELEAAAKPAWQDVRRGFEAAWRDLEDAFQQSAEHFGETEGGSQP